MQIWEAGETIPVTVLTGLSGTGKTTLLQHILQSHEPGKRFAVIENGNGIVEVDDAIIKVASYERIERINRCICCTIRNDLINTLNKLEQRISSFDGVIIETTGMADPAPVVQTFFVDESIRRRYHLDGFITVVDAQSVMMQVEGAKNVSAEQVAFADRIVLNKCDLVAEEQLTAAEKTLKCINTYATIFRSQMGCVEPSNLLNVRAADISRIPTMDPECLGTGGDQQLDTRVRSINMHFVGELNVHKLKFWINGLMKSKAEDLLRYRGLFALKGEQMKCIFQGVHANYTLSLEQEYHWHENEIRECRLVLIGHNLDKVELERGIIECKVGPLRFQLGDCVLVNLDGARWKDGVIGKLWDEGFPYLIEVEPRADSCGCPLKCWAPIDDDVYVKDNKCACEATWNAPSEAVAHGTNVLC